MTFVSAGGLRVASPLHEFVNTEALPGTGVDPDAFWPGLAALVHELAPRNQALLQRRDELQAERQRVGRPVQRKRDRRPAGEIRQLGVRHPAEVLVHHVVDDLGVSQKAGGARLDQRVGCALQRDR